MRLSNGHELRYFKPDEFQGQFELVSVGTLTLLDNFRHEWGAPVTVSPVTGAVARFLGPHAASQHNVDLWGETRAVDVYPSGLVTRADLERAVEIAKRVGFTGIGVYPDARPAPNMHLDTRESARVATWGAIRAASGGWDYLGLTAALSDAQGRGVIA